MPTPHTTENKYLKNKHLITDEYVTLLRAYILINQPAFFLKENEADSWRDFVHFKTMKTDREHLCLPTEPFLVDRSVKDEHVFCICTLSESGKVMIEIPVVKVRELDSHYWRNGYFLLPIL